MLMSIDITSLSDAEKLLFSCGVTSPSHIDLEAIAAHHNVEVVYRQLDGCEARMVRSADRAVISVNASANPGRKRFSLAHEIAHFICDKGRTAFSCASSDIGPQNASAKSVETSANAYASQLVLPSYLVRQESAGRPASLSEANRIHEIFAVSITAAALKLIFLTQEQACVIVHSRGQMRWFRKSLTFPVDAYVLPELPSETEAFTMSFGGARRLTPARRGPADRWFSASGMSIREVEHQSLGIADGEVLTMLRLTR
jgi:Zn-dependent peptidase ImmA (M78 family)